MIKTAICFKINKNIFNRMSKDKDQNNKIYHWTITVPLPDMIYKLKVNLLACFFCPSVSKYILKRKKLEKNS